MAIYDLLIAVDNVNKDIVSESIYEVDHTVEVHEGHTFFTFKEVEVNPKIDLSFVSMEGALDEIGEENYALAMANLATKTLVISGNPQKFGMQAILNYGVPPEEFIH